MYDLAPVLDAEIEPGTNVLVSGPALTGKRAMMFDILADGVRDGDGAVIVTTKDGAPQVLEDFGDRVDIDAKPVAVIDCVTRQQGGDNLLDDDRVEYTSSPVDMTGIGIEFSEVVGGFRDRDVERTRVMFNSLSTLLMYSDLQTVFRFLHVFTGRIQSIGGLGLFAIDASAHDDQTMNTLKQLFEGVITTDEDAAPEVRLAD